MKDTEIAYLAGLIDGEGCICLYQFNRHSRPTGQYRSSLSISNTKMPLLKWIQERFGGRIHQANKGDGSDGNRNPSWIWWCRQSNINPILIAAAPYLVIKREQAALLVEARNIQNGRCGLHVVGVRGSVPNPYPPRMHEIVKRLHELNKRGK